MDIKNFKHKIILHVRFNEVDMLGVCNNAVYISYFEEARLQYIKDAGLIPPNGLFSDGKLFFVVKNEINYFDTAHYDDELAVYSKISYIKNSSFGFEHIIQNLTSGRIIVEGNGVIVHTDPVSKKSLALPSDFYDKVKRFEPSVQILKS